MVEKTYVLQDEQGPASQIGASLESLAETIKARRGAGEESYTYRLLVAGEDMLLKKVMEEAGEVALAAKDAETALRAHAAHAAMRSVSEEMKRRQEDKHAKAIDHLRYEIGDILYHALVVCERYGIPLDELAAELNSRMTEEERPRGCVLLKGEHINRGR